MIADSGAVNNLQFIVEKNVLPVVLFFVEL